MNGVQMMKQAQKLQSKMLRMQEELAERTVETSAGGGMVTVVANGRQQIISIKIEQEVVDPEDVDMLRGWYDASTKMTRASDCAPSVSMLSVCTMMPSLAPIAPPLKDTRPQLKTGCPNSRLARRSTLLIMARACDEKFGAT